MLTGADPAFCAGVDLKEAARDGEAYFDKHRAQPCIPQVARMATPIAKITTRSRRQPDVGRNGTTVIASTHRPGADE